MYSSSDTLQLVLADGSAIVRAGIKRLLADVPDIHVVEECNDAKAAIAAIAEHRPDLVMMDFRLGAGTAVDVLRECRATALPRPISIVYTLETDASTRAISYASGADVFYDKSKDMAPLLTMLRKLSAALLASEELAAT
jgi:DNA-binding NarL/FixJ family response regulator